MWWKRGHILESSAGTLGDRRAERGRNQSPRTGGRAGCGQVTPRARSPSCGRRKGGGGRRRGALRKQGEGRGRGTRRNSLTHALPALHATSPSPSLSRCYRVIFLPSKLILTACCCLAALRLSANFLLCFSSMLKPLAAGPSRSASDCHWGRTRNSGVSG